MQRATEPLRPAARLALSRLRRRLTLGLGLGLCSLSALAQTCAMPGRDGTTASSGTVNTYYAPANGIYAPGSTSIGLGASQGAATALAPGDLVLLMQMQCAHIDSSNSANYGAGDGTGRGYTEPGGCQAGRYEYVRAGAATSAASLDLRGNTLAGTYEQQAGSSANRRTFQVIRVPQHASLTLTGAITAPHWNGSSGGVVVLDVAGALNWNSQSIDVDGRGFRGGAAVPWTGGVDSDTPPDWVATLASDQHATKGEGIAGTPRWVFNPQTNARQDNGATWGGYAGGDQGRGAPGNAGGGGDNREGGRDNGGGGGGGNGGVGGFGGYGWKWGDWGGSFVAGSDVDLRGIGGAAFTSAAPHRLVMGGGGGGPGAPTTTVPTPSTPAAGQGGASSSCARAA